jgi:hypothetical protein
MDPKGLTPEWYATHEQQWQRLGDAIRQVPLGEDTDTPEVRRALNELEAHLGHLWIPKMGHGTSDERRSMVQLPTGPNAPYPVDEEGLPTDYEAVLDYKAEVVARGFHETYERLAPEHGYKTRDASAVPWEDVPENNRSLMVAVARELLGSGVIS